LFQKEAGKPRSGPWFQPIVQIFSKNGKNIVKPNLEEGSSGDVTSMINITKALMDIWDIGDEGISLFLFKFLRAIHLQSMVRIKEK
jgi:hypothetical protein